MYGQTEATARMAYLPPDLAARPSRRHRRADPRRVASGSNRSRTPSPTPASSSTPGRTSCSATPRARPTSASAARSTSSQYGVACSSSVGLLYQSEAGHPRVLRTAAELAGIRKTFQDLVVRLVCIGQEAARLHGGKVRHGLARARAHTGRRNPSHGAAPRGGSGSTFPGQWQSAPRDRNALRKFRLTLHARAIRVANGLG